MDQQSAALPFLPAWYFKMCGCSPFYFDHISSKIKEKESEMENEGSSASHCLRRG